MAPSPFALGPNLLKPPAAPLPLTLGDVAKMSPAEKLATFGFVGATAATRLVAAAQRSQPKPPKPQQPVLAQSAGNTAQRTPGHPMPAAGSGQHSLRSVVGAVVGGEKSALEFGAKFLAGDPHKTAQVVQAVTGVKTSNLKYLEHHPTASVQMTGPYKLKPGQKSIGIVPWGAGPAGELTGEAVAAAHVAEEGAAAAAPKPARPLPVAIQTAQKRADALRGRLAAAQEDDAQWIARQKAKVAAAPMTHSQATARLSQLNDAHDSLVKTLIPETSPYGPQVKGSAAQAEQLWRNTANSKLPEGSKLPTVKQEEYQTAEAHLHDIAERNAATNPNAARVHALVTERQNLQDLVNQHGEASLTGEASPFAPEGSTPKIGVSPHRDTIVKLGTALEVQQQHLDELTAAHEARTARMSQPQTGPIDTAAETEAKLAAAEQDPRYYKVPPGRPGVEPEVSAWGNRAVAEIRRGGAPAGATLRPVQESAPVGGRIEGPKTQGQSVIDNLKGIDPVQAEADVMRGAEANKRFSTWEQMIRADNSPEGRAAANKALAGKYPTLGWGKFADYTPEAHQAMHDAVVDHPALNMFERKRAGDALDKLREGTRPPRNEVQLLRVVFGSDVTRNLVKSADKFADLKATAFDVLNTPRAVMASMDVSGVGRQSLMAAMVNPKIVAKNVPDMFRAAFSEEKYQQLMEQLRNRSYVTSGRAHDVGLDLTELAPPGEGHGSTVTREESFASPLAERLPVMGHVVRGSGRAYTYLLNKTRVDLAEYLDTLVAKNAGKEYTRIRWSPEGGGRGPRLVKERLDPSNPEVTQSIGSLTNSATGRGDLGEGRIGRSSDLINLLFFSPRLAKSRIDFLANPAFYGRMHPLVRRQAYKAMAGLIGTMAVAVTAAKEIGSPINLDPRSSDFAKIRIGPTRIDLAGGFLQYFRLLSEAVTQQTVTSSGETKNLSGFLHGAGGFGSQSDLTLFLNFLRGKLAPMASLVTDVGSGKTGIGQAVNWKSLDPTVNPAMSRMIPLSLQDAINTGQMTTKSRGLPTGILAGLGGFGVSASGVGIQSYKLKKSSSAGGGASSYSTGPSGSGGSSYANGPGGGDGSSYAYGP